MWPALKPGNSVISFNWYYLLFRLKPNDLIVAKLNNKLLIKRVRKLDGGDKVWIEGDNKNESTDSRTFGWIRKSDLVGKVIRIIE